MEGGVLWLSPQRLSQNDCVNNSNLKTNPDSRPIFPVRNECNQIAMRVAGVVLRDDWKKVFTHIG